MPFLQQNGSSFDIKPTVLRLERRDRGWLYSSLATNHLYIYIYANEISRKKYREFSTRKRIFNAKKFLLFSAPLKTFWTRVDGRFVVRRSREEGRNRVFRDSSYSKRGRIDLDVYLSAAER